VIKNSIPGLIDETVRVAKRFLEEHPEEVKKLSLHGRLTIVGANIVCAFLGWNENRVAYSLERLGLIDEGVVDQEEMKKLVPTGATLFFPFLSHYRRYSVRYILDIKQIKLDSAFI